MAGSRHGKNTVVLVDGVKLSTGLRDTTVGVTIETGDDTVYGSTWRHFLPGVQGSEVSFGLVVNAAHDDKWSALAGASTNPVVTVGVESDTVGRTAHLLRAVESNYEITSPVGDIVAGGASLVGTTGWDSGRWLRALAAATSTGASASVDSGLAAGTAGGGVAHFHVTATSTSGSTVDYTIKVQHSSAAVSWADLITFASSSTGVRVSRSTAAGTVKRYTRAAVTAMGGFTSVTAAVAFART